MQMQYKAMPTSIEVKSEEGAEVLHIRAYVAAFDNVDSYGDIIARGAFDAFLASEEASRMRLCYQHDIAEVIGVITEKGVDDYGFWIEADILDTTTGKDVQKLILAEALNEFSIGYYAKRWHNERRQGYDYDLRILDEVSVVEASVVSRAANPKAILLDAKNEDCLTRVRAMSNDELCAIKEAIDTEYYSRIVNNLR